MKWTTRKNVKVDRVACPWLIKRFVDLEAEFLFVEEKDLIEEAKQHDAIPFDAPKIEAVKLNHRGSRCWFEAILGDYTVTDASLQKLALIVRAADVQDQEGVASKAMGYAPSLRGSPPWVFRTRSARFGSFLLRRLVCLCASQERGFIPGGYWDGAVRPVTAS